MEQPEAPRDELADSRGPNGEYLYPELRQTATSSPPTTDEGAADSSGVEAKPPTSQPEESAPQSGVISDPLLASMNFASNFRK